MTRKLSVQAKVSTLAMAVALVAGPSPAAAQFIGSIDSSAGIDTVNSTNSNIIVTGQQAVVNWTATDTPASGVIAFLPEGNSATFSGAGDFAILNRVTPGTAGNAIFMGGNITSLIGESVGGTVFFYSPNGIIIGQNAAINVGALGLTTLPIADDGEGNWMNGFGTANPQVTFGQATDPNSFVRTVSVIDGSINAWGSGSYVALVAPRIEHGGVIRTDTAAALVAAEAATITFSPDGLFDIEVNVGTDDANGIDVNGGKIERRNLTEGNGSHYAYLVAVAKNDAVTMLVQGGGEVGFDTATSAEVEDNVVVLSGGRDIANGQVGTATGAAPVNLNIDSSSFTTDVIADVSGSADIRTSSGNTSFGLDPASTSLDLTAGDDSIITATNGNTLSIAGSLWADLDVDGAGASATGNVFRLSTISASTLTIGGNVTITAQTFGAGGEGVNGGNATGGTAIVQTSSGGTIDIAGDLSINVDGWGGSAVGFDLSGGNGIGGIAHILANGGSGASLTVGGQTNVSASGHGGTVGDDCLSCQITGGNGSGGTILLQALTGSGNLLDLNDSVNLTATGEGGPGDQAGGNGLGGTIQLTSGDSGAISIAGDLTADADGMGGFATGNETTGGQGGTGTGNLVDASIAVTGGTLTVEGVVDFHADGHGGGAAGTGGIGGAGFGGTSRFTALAGSATFGNMTVSADGFGGDADAGNGGLGRGGTAGINTFGNAESSIDLGGPVFVTADGQGGSGVNGGTGTGGIAYISAILGTIHAFDDVLVSANSDGGDANSAGGTGGSGLADIETGVTPQMTEAGLFASGGTLIVDGLTIVSANATGGNGGLNGGDAVAAGVAGVIDGGAIIHAANSDDGPSVIELGDVVVTAEAQGGQGGDGLGGTNGSDGGDGGNATGGKAVVTAAAGSGNVAAGSVLVSASATGGDGGDGGSGDGGDGGDAGNGGSATGGFINVGAESGNVDFAQDANNGVANYGSIIALATATGGDGGDGGFGNIAGLGGAGGDAIGGDSVLLVRGSEVTIGEGFGSVTLDGSAFGGNGGLSPTAPDGDGGDATTGTVGVLITNRFQHIDQRGILTAGDISGTAIATSGTGGLGDGLSQSLGGNLFVVSNSDATINSVALTQIADGLDLDAPATFNSPVAVVNGTVDIAGGFIFSTPGTASVYADDNTPLTPSLTAASFTVVAHNFIHDSDPARAGPATVGTISANNFNFTTGQDLVLDAHVIATNSLNLFAPGLIDIRDATSGGDLTLQAGDTISGGTQAAAGFVSVFALGDIALGNVNAGSSIDIESANGDVSLALLSAGSSIDLDALGDIGFVDVTADDFDFSAGGDVTGGDIIAGTFATGDAGGTITLGDINVGILQEGGASDDGFAAGFSSAGSIIVGDVEVDEAIGFATLGDLTTDDLNAGTDVMTLIGGDTTIASIATGSGGRTYHGDVQMFFDAGGPDDFDASLVFEATPIQSGGSYTVAGDISTGTIQVGAASISTGGILALDSAFLDGAGSVSTGTIDTGLLQISAGTDISTGDIFAFDGVDMDAGGSILAGDIAGGSIDLFAGSDITTGDLTTQIFQLFGEGGIGTLLFPGASITLESGGDINTGDIASIDGVYLNAGGSILTGDIFAFGFVEAHAGTSLTADDIDAGNYVLLSAGTDLAALAVGGSDIDASAGGTATVGGTWSAGNVQITSNNIDISASGSIFAGDISLTSTNASQTVVGDGVAGGGYQLSDAEYDRLHANDITVIADAGLGAAALMLIGDLSVDGSDGEAIHDYEFITGDSESESAEGSIRILGDMVFTNMGTVQSVGFTTGTFELDAATGLLSLESAPGVLGGELFLNAAHIHVASGAILDQLADDPQYEGYQEDLNAPAAVQRPEGVIRAASIDITFGDAGQGQLNTLYVQNTGTAEVPAGFLISGQSLFGEGNEVTPPPGSIDLIINGQVVTEGGNLTGIDVRDALVEAEGDITPFTDNSTINGCQLVGPCVAEPPEPPFPPDFTPNPGIQDEITLIDDGALPPPEFGNEDVIDDNDEETDEGETSPIVPPDPLFDTSELGEADGVVGKEIGTPMRSKPGLTQPGDVDDPVSGSGNPGLIETPPTPPSNEEQQP